MCASLVVRDIKDRTELEEFARCYMNSFRNATLQPKQAIHVTSLLTYKRVIGVYQNASLVAGYVVNDYPHRCFEYFDEDTRQNIVRSIGGKENVCEVVAVWKSPSISRFNFLAKVWSRVILDTLKENRRYIFGCSYAGHGMKKCYYLTNPKTVREGESDNDLSVFYYTRFQFALTYFATFAFVIAKLLFSRNSNKVKLKTFAQTGAKNV